jgi:uncharacterized membrane protein (DUF4010 family)
VLAVVLPLLPAEPVDPWGVLPPRRIGLFVALISGISFLGYLASRLLGGAGSAALTGLVGGLVSSTAVTAAMAQQAATRKALAGPGQLAVLLANVVMLGRVLVVTAVISRELVLALAFPLGAMGLVLLGAALLVWRGLRTAHAAGRGAGGALLTVANPFALLPALKWGLLLCVVLVVSRLAQDFLGDAGLLAAAAVSGLADVDPMTLAASRQVAGGTLSVHTASLAISIAVLANTAVKAGIAWIAGGAAFGNRVALALGAAAAIGVLVALLR